jgi:hypothetical protein
VTRARARAFTVLSAAGLAVALAASPATAQRVDGGTYHEVFPVDGPLELTDFCDVTGLTVDYRSVVDGHYVGVARGTSGYAYYNDRQRVTQTYTNQATGLTVVDVQRILSKDLKITKVGTVVTIVQLATGYGATYGPDGRVIARNPGQVRFRIVFDDNGTPGDDTDDTEISFDQIKGSTGRTDDFCAAVVPAIS